MSKIKRLFAFLLLSTVVIGAAPQVLLASPFSAKEVVNRSVLASNELDESILYSNYNVRKSSTPRKHPYPTQDFWDKLAQCETAQNWQDGGRWAGGLGIYTSSRFPKAAMGTWERFGGEQFAPSPNKATKEEQVIVANRIAIDGYKQVVHRDPDWARRQGVPATYLWDQQAVGLGGWGCYKSKSTGKYRMSKPKMYYYENYKDVIHFTFVLNEKSKAVHDLQVFLGVKVDSRYGPKTQNAHKAYVKKYIVRPSDAVEANTVSAQSIKHKTGEVERCPKWEKLLRQNNLPVKQFSYIMWRESRCQSKVIGWNYKSGTGYWSCKTSPAPQYKKCKAVKSYDSGLLQINSSWKTVTSQVCKSKWGDLSVLLDSKCNISVALHLYNSGGMNHWKATSSSDKG